METRPVGGSGVSISTIGLGADLEPTSVLDELDALIPLGPTFTTDRG